MSNSIRQLTDVGWHFYFFYSLFVMRHFNYFLDKCGVLNEIIEPAIFIFKINTNKICNTHLRRISKHNLIPISSVKNTYETLVKFRNFDLSPVRIIGNIF